MRSTTLLCCADNPTAINKRKTGRRDSFHSDLVLKSCKLIKMTENFQHRIVFCLTLQPLQLFNPLNLSTRIATPPFGPFLNIFHLMHGRHLHWLRIDQKHRCHHCNVMDQSGCRIDIQGSAYHCKYFCTGAISAASSIAGTASPNHTMFGLSGEPSGAISPGRISR